MKYSVTVIRDLDGSLPLRLGYKKSVDVILYPKLCTDSWFSLTFSKRIPEGLCNLFQVNDLTFGRNASEEESGHFLCFPSSCVLVCCGILGGFLFAFISGCMVKFSTFSNQFLTSLAYYSVGSLCQSEKPIWNAVIWLDRNRTADRVQRLRCVRGTQTDCRIDSLCEAPVAPMFTLSDGPFWQPSQKQTSHSRKKEMPHHKTT